MTEIKPGDRVRKVNSRTSFMLETGPSKTATVLEVDEGGLIVVAGHRNPSARYKPHNLAVVEGAPLPAASETPLYFVIEIGTVYAHPHDGTLRTEADAREKAAALAKEMPKLGFAIAKVTETVAYEPVFRAA